MVKADMADMVVLEVRLIMMVVTLALKTSRTSMQMLRLIVLFLRRNPNFLSSSLERGVKATIIIVVIMVISQPVDWHKEHVITIVVIITTYG